MKERKKEKEVGIKEKEAGLCGKEPRKGNKVGLNRKWG